MMIYYKNNNEFKHVDINIWSGNLQKNESMVWSHTEQRGILQKHFSKTYAITNFRIFVYNHEISKMTGLLLMSELDDVVVMDTTQTFSSIGYGISEYGVFGGQFKGESIITGKIIFMSKGEPIISLIGVTDPQGLRNMTLSIKRSYFPKEELERWISGIKSDDPSVMHSTVCLRCSTMNVKNSSFCSNCGSVLR